MFFHYFTLLFKLYILIIKPQIKLHSDKNTIIYFGS